MVGSSGVAREFIALIEVVRSGQPPRDGGLRQRVRCYQSVFLCLWYLWCVGLKAAAFRKCMHMLQYCSSGVVPTPAGVTLDLGKGIRRGMLWPVKFKLATIARGYILFADQSRQLWCIVGPIDVKFVSGPRW